MNPDDNSIFATADGQLLATELAVTAKGGAAIARWSDDKKAAFANTFEQRSKASQAILLVTAQKIWQKAEKLGFVSFRHARNVIDNPTIPTRLNALYDVPRSYGSHGKVGGRNVDDLVQIAEERAQAIIDDLPALKKAVEILDPDTAKLIGEREKIRSVCDRLDKQLDDASADIVMSEMDQSMTIGDFRKYVAARQKAREQLRKKLHAAHKRGAEIDITVTKRLCKGIPHLSETIVDVIKAHLERATGLDTFTRRAVESIKFGDSANAVELLRQFERDEPTVGVAVREQFRAALERLQLATSGKKAKRGKK